MLRNSDPFMHRNSGLSFSLYQMFCEILRTETSSLRVIKLYRHCTQTYTSNISLINTVSPHPKVTVSIASQNNLIKRYEEQIC